MSDTSNTNKHWHNWRESSDDHMELQYSTYGTYDDSGDTQYHPDADLQSTATEAGEANLKQRCEVIIKQAGLHTMKITAGGKTISEETFDFDNDIGYAAEPGDCYDGASLSVTLYPGSEQSQIQWFELIRDTLAKAMNDQNDAEGNDSTWLAMAESLYEHSHTVIESDPDSIRALEDNELIYGSDCVLVKVEDATPEDIAHHRSFTMTEDERKIYEFVKEKKAVNNNA